MSTQIDVGWLVKSTQGRDLGEIYIVIDIIGNKVLLVNGQNRFITLPKTKNIKHIEGLVCNENLQDKLKNKVKIFDAEIYSNIKKFKENI